MRLIRTVVAALSAVVLVGLVGVLVVMDGREPPKASAESQPAIVEVPPGQAEAVCPVELKLVGDESGQISYDPSFDPRPTEVEAITRMVVDGPLGGEMITLGQGAVVPVSPPVGILSQEVTAKPWLVQGRSSAAAVAVASGGVIIHAKDGDLRSLAGGSCVVPAAEAWLVGGSTEVGSSARLMLTNPGLTQVTVDLTLWDGAGLIDTVGTSGLVVPPESQRAVLLEGIVAEASRLAVRVLATGGDLAVYLQHARMHALTPAGVDLVMPGSAPNETQVIAGLSVSASRYDDPDTALIRVANPGELEATVSVQLWGTSGVVSLPGLDQASLPAGAVVDLSLAGLQAGTYAAVVQATKPVVAAGMTVRHGEADGAREFAWSAAAAAPVHGFLALPTEGISAMVSVAAASDTTVSLRALAPGGVEEGQVKTLALKSGTMSQLDPVKDLGAGPEAAVIEYTFVEPVQAAVAMNLTTSDAAGEMITTLVPPVGTREEGSVVSVFRAR